jgi:hypothetical protein
MGCMNNKNEKYHKKRQRCILICKECLHTSYSSSLQQLIIETLHSNIETYCKSRIEHDDIQNQSSTVIIYNRYASSIKIEHDNFNEYCVCYST